MKFNKLLLFALALLILLSGLAACNAEKDVAERRGLMMPKKSEMPQNSRYKEVSKRKVNKYKPIKAKNKSLF